MLKPDRSILRRCSRVWSEERRRRIYTIPTLQILICWRRRWRRFRIWLCRGIWMSWFYDWDEKRKDRSHDQPSQSQRRRRKGSLNASPHHAQHLAGIAWTEDVTQRWNWAGTTSTSLDTRFRHFRRQEKTPYGAYSGARARSLAGSRDKQKVRRGRYYIFVSSLDAAKPSTRLNNRRVKMGPIFGEEEKSRTDEQGRNLYG